MHASIEGKVILVTGASSGVGMAAARGLAAHGARLVLAARREDRLQALAESLEQEGAQVLALRTDVARREDMQALADAALTRFGRIDVLINNAGVMPLSRIDALRVDEWDRMIDINLKGVLYGMAAVLPAMKAQGEGHVINVASTAGHRTGPTSAVYSATKHAVRALSEGFRQEMAAFNVRSTIISPGAIATELLDGISEPALASQLRKSIVAYMTPDDVAGAIIYAIGQPASVGINEILMRPTAQQP